MPRPFHSASSIELGNQCERAWAYRYIAKLRTPEVPWSAFEGGTPVCTHDPRARGPRGACRLCSRARSAALGTATHAVGEAWYTGGTCAWGTLPGRIFLSGAHLLPHPSRCVARTEVNIGVAYADLEWGPRNAVEIGGIRWIGKRDLTACVDAVEAARLGLRAPTVLIDFKTTASIGRYAKTADDLRGDVQCNLYALDVMRETGARVAYARWLYLASKEVREARAVDVMITIARATDVVCEAAEVAKRLDTLERVEESTCNPDACSAYGGCVYSATIGGPCTARRSLSSAILALKRGDKREIPMAMSPEQLENLRRLNSASTPTDVPADVPADVPVASRRRGRPPRMAPAPVASVAPVAPVADVPSDAVGVIKGLIADRNAALATADSISSQLAALRDTLAAALAE